MAHKSLRYWLKLVSFVVFSLYVMFCLYIVGQVTYETTINAYLVQTPLKIGHPSPPSILPVPYLSDELKQVIRATGSIQGTQKPTTHFPPAEAVKKEEEKAPPRHRWVFDPAGHKHFHEEQERLEKERIRKEHEYMYLNSTASRWFKQWYSAKRSLCMNSINIYGDILTVLHNVTVKRHLASAKAKGDEEVQDVLKQKDSEEDYRFQQGFFTVPCGNNTKVPLLKLKGKAAHLINWERCLAAGLNTNAKNSVMVTDPVILITRYEYANVYWTMMDLYDAYLTATFLNTTLADSQLMIVDAHPHTELDTLWTTVFKSVKRPHQLANTTVFTNLAWTFGREFSPMLIKGPSLPLVKEFRSTVLKSFQLPVDHSPHCKGNRSLNVLFIWRRNYVAHPRNPSGVISRKIKNEDELLKASRKAFPKYNITGLQLDKLPAAEQFRVISQTDIFIGMHGAAYGFVLLLPKASGVVEMFPKSSGANWHMEYLSRWAGHHYSSWTNTDSSLEDKIGKYTTIPPNTVVQLLKSASDSVCSGKPPPVIKVPTPRPRPTKKPKTTPSFKVSDSNSPAKNSTFQKQILISKTESLKNSSHVAHL